MTPCIVCGAPIIDGQPGGHDPDCLLDDGRLTVAELSDLRIIRERAYRDRGDVAPMQRVTYSARPTNGHAGGAFVTGREVIPWLEAVNLEV